jgi:hypothetical protein
MSNPPGTIRHIVVMKDNARFECSASETGWLCGACGHLLVLDDTLSLPCGHCGATPQSVELEAGSLTLGIGREYTWVDETSGITREEIKRLSQRRVRGRVLISIAPLFAFREQWTEFRAGGHALEVPTTACSDCPAIIPVAEAWESKRDQRPLCEACFRKAEKAGRAREGR